MIKIGICDDNEIEYMLLKKIVTTLLTEKGLDYEISTFSKGEELLSAMEKEAFQLLFLDIMMEGIDGIHLGKLIRNHDLDTEIIYCTSSQEFLLASYEVFALGYVIKPYEVVQIGRLLDYFIHKHGISSTKYIMVKSNFMKRKIFFDEIIYVESMNKVVLFQTSSSGEIKVYDKLGNIEKELNNDNFLRCHQSYIINMDFVARMDESEFITITNQVIPIRRKDRKLLRERYYSYMEKKEGKN